MKYIVSISGGLGSAEALRRTIQQHSIHNTVAVFADVKGHGSSHFFSDMPLVDTLMHERFGGESRDTYRFIWQLSELFGLPVHRVGDDRSIWYQFAKSRAMRIFTGNVFYCPASEHLKRIAIAEWIKAQGWDAGEWTMVLGMGWDEGHRIKSSGYWWSRYMGYDVPVIAPNAVMPFADTITTMDWLNKADVEAPAAYSQNMGHNNCHGGCVQAGLSHWANLYKERQPVYMYWAWMERRMQQYLGKGVTIMKDQRGGETTPLSLYDFIPRIESGDYPKRDYGACGCFTNSAMAEFLAQCEIRQPA